jgi:superfamily II DNA or RNA helicase
MGNIRISTTKQVIPMIYAYSTPEIARHNGWLKIGYTEQEVHKRLNQQTHTADVEFSLEWKGNAIFEDGSGEIFRDSDFHSYLRKNGVENKKKTEWFRIDKTKSKHMFYDFKENRGILEQNYAVLPYTLRQEQNEAVQMAKNYFESHENGKFLWNAKPRFGKTLSVYDLCKAINANSVLIVTNRPAIANSWYEDYKKFMGSESGYLFVSSTESLKGKPYVLTREDYITYNHNQRQIKDKKRCIEFLSLQDLKGSLYFGGMYDKLKHVKDMQWDILVIDEAHEGVDTYKTDIAFNQIKRNHTLHLSGTPFKALANDKFPQGAIFNYTYADEQKKKREWNSPEENPYANLPQLNLFTYQMSEIIKDELSRGTEINGETVEYAFDLNEFFATNESGKFLHESSVDKFLDALTKQEKFPFSTEELRNELKHTFWLLNRVSSAKALAKKLNEHPVFQNYEIVLAAGDGRLSEDEENKKAYNKVVEAIKNNDKTITLSVGQLTTGITIPEWTGVLILSNVKSPALYMQTAFRSQNPCLFIYGSEYHRKKNAYVFDFDPARTLVIFEQFANDLSAETSDGRGDAETHKNNVRTLLNFFPVIGEDENGKMIELDAEKVLSIPRKIRSQEVVRRGFMSDFLFQNISNVFRAPQEVIDIIKNFTPVAEPNSKLNLTTDTGDDLHLDGEGNVNIDDNFVIGTATKVLGDKVYDITEQFNDCINDLELENTKNSEQDTLKDLKNIFKNQVTEPLMSSAKEHYGADLTKSSQKRIEKKINREAEKIIATAYGDYTIKSKELETSYQKKLQEVPQEEKQKVQQEYKEKAEEIKDNFKQTLSKEADDFVDQLGQNVVKTVETNKKESEKKDIEQGIKDHLRGFSRTIPSFLMAYGDNEVTLENFDKIIPDNVFVEVTSITLEQFRFLRDGGDYVEQSTGETKHFNGKLFEPIVFNDSVKEFMNLKKQLANYFDESNTEDIFDYIPPQKTNQIFTPKWVVQKMVDELENENPNCFDDPNHTFLDPYMKSGMYITEIVKRLFQSPKMKELFPNDNDRLKHIFEKQVYGLAPTKIIYRIAISYILGFSDIIDEHNFRQVDALEYAKSGTLQQKIDELFD